MAGTFCRSRGCQYVKGGGGGGGVAPPTHRVGCVIVIGMSHGVPSVLCRLPVVSQNFLGNGHLTGWCCCGCVLPSPFRPSPSSMVNAHFRL